MLFAAFVTLVTGLDAAITVRLKAASCPDWTNVCLYAWSDAVPDLLGQWPGVSLAQDVEGYWAYTFDETVEGVNIIFNSEVDADRLQTQDIPNVTASTDYVLGALLAKNTYSVSVEGSDVPVSPYDFMMPNTSFYFRVTEGKKVMLVNELGSAPYYSSSSPAGDVSLPQYAYDASGNFTDMEVTAIGAHAFAGCGSVDEDCSPINFEETFAVGLGDFTTVSGSGSHTWVHERNYAKINGYGDTEPNEDWLISPAFDFEGKENIKLSFDHAINYNKADMPSFHRIVILSGYTGDNLEESVIGMLNSETITWPTGSDWNFVTANVDFPLQGSDMRIAFVYTSNDENTTAWNIKNVRLTCDCAPRNALTSLNVLAGIESIGDSAFYKCDALRQISFKAGLVPALGKDVFLGCDALEGIWVPCGLGEQFRTQWPEQAHLIKETEEAVRIFPNVSDWGAVEFLQQPVCANGNVAQLEARPVDGYRFLHWTSYGMQESTDNPLTVDMDTISDRFLQATFIETDRQPITIRLKKDEAWDNCELYYHWPDGSCYNHTPKQLAVDGEGFYTYELMEYPATILFRPSA